MSRFEQIFNSLILEDSIAGAGGVFGDTAGMSKGGQVPGGSDFYAPGDSRVPYSVGTFKRNKKNKKRKKVK